MAGAVDLHEGEVARGLDLAILLAFSLEGRELCALEALVSRPLKLVAPGLVAKPVTDEVGITSVDEHWDLLENTGDEQVEWLHPVALEEEVSVNVEVAAVVAVDRLHAQGIHDVLLVEVLVDVAKAWVAEAASLAVNTNVVGVTARSLVGSKDLVVAVDGCRDAAHPALALVARGDHALATRQGVVHGLALTLAKHGIVATFAACHGAVVRVLRVGVRQAIADKDRLEVDVAVLVRQDLRGKDGDVVTGIRLAADVEILLGVLGELLEEEGQQGVDVLAGSVGVADGVAAV